MRSSIAEDSSHEEYVRILCIKWKHPVHNVRIKSNLTLQVSHTVHPPKHCYPIPDISLVHAQGAVQLVSEFEGHLDALELTTFPSI